MPSLDMYTFDISSRWYVHSHWFKILLLISVKCVTQSHTHTPVKLNLINSHKSTVNVAIYLAELQNILILVLAATLRNVRSTAAFTGPVNFNSDTKAVQF